MSATVTRITRRNSHYYKVSGDPQVPENTELPSVTSIIGAVTAKPWLVPWAVRSTLEAVDELLMKPDFNPLSLTIEAKSLANEEMRLGAEIGEATHQAISLWLANTDSPACANYIDSLDETIKTKVLIGLDSCRRFIDDYRTSSGLVVKDVERAVYLPWKPYDFIGFGGTIDCVMANSIGRLIVVDWKTGDNIGAAALMQVAAYTMALEYLEPGKFAYNSVIVQLNKESVGYTAHHITSLTKWRSAFTAAISLWAHIHNFKIANETS